MSAQPTLFEPAAPSGVELRPYQEEAIEATERYYAQGGTRPLWSVATGAGKTLMAAMLLERNLNGRRGLFLAHREELIDQAVRTIGSMTSLTVAAEQAGKRAGDAQVVVGCVPTLVGGGGRRLRALDRRDFGMVIVDECHRSTARTYLQALHHFGLAPDPDVFTIPDAEDDDEEQAVTTKRRKAAARSRRKTIDGFRPEWDAPLLLGVTATPHRADRIGLEVAFDEVVFERGIRELIAEGWLCVVRGVRVESGTDLNRVHVRAGEFAEKELSDAVNSPERNALIVAAYHDHAPGRQAIVFAASVQHAQDLCEAFQGSGVRAAWASGATPTVQRQGIVAAYKRREVQVLLNCQLWTEGFDAPLTDCIVMARPTKSSGAYAQMLGRGTRIAPGKVDLVVIDIVDNYRKAGIVSANALFGLPPRFRTGDSLAEDAGRFEAQLTLLGVPAEELGEATDWQSVSRIASTIDPLRVAALDPVLAAFARYTWHVVPWGYALQVPAGSLGIVTDGLGHGHVRWQPKGARPTTLWNEMGADASMAVRWAERWLDGVDPSAGRLVDKQAAWRQRNDPPTEKQIKMARWLKVPVVEGMTKGQLSSLLDAAQARRQER